MQVVFSGPIPPISSTLETRGLKGRRDDAVTQTRIPPEENCSP